MWSTQWIFVMLGLLMVASNNAQVCSNGITGVEGSDACCVAECGTCGGSGCGSRARAVSLSSGDCCIGPIRDANVFCAESDAAPCLINIVEETCSSNGLPGIEAGGVCCAAECPQCGGSGCGSQAQSVGLTSSDCCVGPITSAGVFCDDSEMAPCIIGDDPSVEMCSNGITGIEAGGVCCVAECPQCGGSGCGSQAKSVGLASSDCCVGAITSAGVSCDGSGMAPCVIDSGEVCGPALTITLEWSESLNDVDLTVTEPDDTLVRFSNMVGSAGFLDMDIREGPGVEIYTIFSGLDTDAVSVLGDYKVQVRRFSGPSDTMWTLVATLVEEVVWTETGDFTQSSDSEFFTVSVTDYDSSCEGTEPFPSGSRGETSSAEDKLPY